MSRQRLAISVLVACFLAIACANRLPASALAPRLQYQGFSAERPPTDSWYINRNEQDHTTLLFRREVSGEAHSFFFAVRPNGLEREPRSTRTSPKSSANIWWLSAIRSVARFSRIERIPHPLRVNSASATASRASIERAQFYPTSS